MSVVNYETNSYRSQGDGRFYGSVAYGAETIATVNEADNGFKSERDFDKWARFVAADHKASITPSATHVVKKTFAL